MRFIDTVYRYGLFCNIRPPDQNTNSCYNKKSDKYRTYNTQLYMYIDLITKQIHYIIKYMKYWNVMEHIQGHSLDGINVSAKF